MSLDLYEVCPYGYPLHYFHGKPPRNDHKSRYSATCGVCNKEALENQPYFMHCYICEYDKCSACAKLEVHFDQIEQTKCTNMHAMKIHRGYLKRDESVACNECRVEKCLEKSPYFFHCLKCNESKCITCSRHDTFALHQFVSFMDTEDNFLQLALEFDEDTMRNELHLYKTAWDSEESAPNYISNVKCIQLNMREKTVVFDDDITYQVQNTYETHDSWEEFVLDAVPLAKISHVRIEYYDTHINKSGYPVYKGDEEGNAFCGKRLLGSEKVCKSEDQCDHCKHFTTKVKADPGHSWWSRIGGFVSGVVDSIPVVGHVKGAVEYGLGYKEAARESFEAATRTTVVMGAGALGVAVGGPAGAIGAGVAAGALFDAAESGIDSAIHNKWTPHGEMKHFTNIVQGNSTTWDYVSLGMDTVFDGFMGADGGAMFKNSFKKSAETGLVGEVQRDFNMQSAEEVAKMGGHSAVPGGTKVPIAEFPPHMRVEYHLREHKWTPRSTGLDEPMLQEINQVMKRMPKDDSEVRYGLRELTLDCKPWWSYENDFRLKNNTIKSLRTDVYNKITSMKCEITNKTLQKVQKDVPKGLRKNVDHAFEHQLHVVVNNSTLTDAFTQTQISNVGKELKLWQNSPSNLWVMNAEMNIMKRDATNALKKGELVGGKLLSEKDAYKEALQYYGFKPDQANKVINKIKVAFKDLTNRAKKYRGKEQELIREFVNQAEKMLHIPNLWNA